MPAHASKRRSDGSRRNIGLMVVGHDDERGCAGGDFLGVVVRKSRQGEASVAWFRDGRGALFLT